MIVLYTIDCPKCKILEKKLKEAGVAYDRCTDVSVMEQKGLDFLPALEVNNEIIGFKKAITWVNERG